MCRRPAKGDLDRQVARIRASMAGETFAEIVVITDVASGLSDKRKGLVRLMGMAREGRITDVAITYKDRLTRFGFGYLEQFCRATGVFQKPLDGWGRARKEIGRELEKALSTKGNSTPASSTASAPRVRHPYRFLLARGAGPRHGGLPRRRYPYQPL